MTRRLVVALLLLAASSVAAPAHAAPPTFTDAAGIHVVSTTQLDDRQYDVVLLSDALGQPVTVRLLLPVGYDASDARYPTLYLYTGTGGTHADWVAHGDAVTTTAPHQLITVMPDVGLPGQGVSSFFVDWHDQSTQWGPSKWETFQVDQLLPWIDANLRTVATRDGRAVAGLSQGGFGSMMYAARNPDRFTSVVSMSGLASIDGNPAAAALTTAFVAGMSAANSVGPDAYLGSRLTDQANWMGHDPADLVTNLRPLDVWLFSGNGLPGPLDSGPPDPTATAIEILGHTLTDVFAQRAAEVGLPVTYLDYGPGTHTFPYWARDLREYLPPLMARFAAPPPPGPVDYQAIDPQWSQWGWDVAIERAQPLELSRLSAASITGFVLQGTGTATVRSPPAYEPGTAATVSVGGTTQQLIVDPDGQLTIPVPLGGTPTLLLPGVPDRLTSAGRTEVAIDAIPTGQAGTPPTSGDVAMATPAPTGRTSPASALPATGSDASGPLALGGVVIAMALLIRHRTWTPATALRGRSTRPR